MATTTENLGLTLPAGTDRAEISVLNENFQTLDTFAGQATADIQEAQETANAAAPQATTYTKDEVDAAIEEAIEHGGGGTTDYTDLTNKPSINGVVLTGNKTTSDLGIEENVQADWDEADTTAPSYIKNKPNIPSGVVVDTTYDGTSVNAQAGTAVAQAISTKVDKVTGKGLSTNDFTNADKTKLEGIESGAEANVQANWAQTDTTADDYIKNKPTIPSPVTVDQTYSASSANAQSGVAVAQAISTKVDKETGKGLSTNDFTNADKANLGTALTKANAAAPQATTYTKTEVDTALAAKLNTADVDAELSSTSTNPVQNKAVHAPIARLVDAGAKNLLNNAVLAMYNGTGVTITDNQDGTYSLSGTATGTADYLHTATSDFSFMLNRGERYAISVGSSKTMIRVDYSTNGTSWDNGGGSGLVENVLETATFTIPNNAVALYIRFRSMAANGTLDGVVLSPMICTAEDYTISQEFVPYTPTMRELYDMILALQNGG